MIQDTALRRDHRGGKRPSAISASRAATITGAFMARPRMVVLPIGVKPASTAPCQGSAHASGPDAVVEPGQLPGRWASPAMFGPLWRCSGCTRREVRWVVVLFMLLGDDVIDLVGPARPIGGAGSIRSDSGPSPDEPLDIRLHGSFAHLSDNRAFDWRTIGSVDPDILLELGPLLG